MQQVKKMGPLQNVIGMLPGMPKEVRNAEIDDRRSRRIEAIIRSMTPEERRKPDAHQRLAPAADRAGERHVNTADVNNLLKQFKQVQQMMKGMGGLTRKAKGQEGQARARAPRRCRPADCRVAVFTGGGLPGWRPSGLSAPVT